MIEQVVWYHMGPVGLAWVDCGARGVLHQMI